MLRARSEIALRTPSSRQAARERSRASVWLAIVIAFVAGCGASRDDRRPEPSSGGFGSTVVGGTGGTAGGGSGGFDFTASTWSEVPLTGGASGGGASGGGASGVGSEPATGGVGGGDPSRFDELVGTDIGRNDVAGGEVCERIATIQCAGEATCCDAPGRDFDTCKAAMKEACVDNFYDAVTANVITGYDRALAAEVFDDFEGLTRSCDVSVVAWGTSASGLRGLTRGSLAPGAACQPAAIDLISPGAPAAAFLLACESLETHACLPTLAAWSCAPRAGEGGACFIDTNCADGLFCTNTSERDIAGGTCQARKSEGKACELTTECESLACKSDVCAARTQDNVFCLQ